MQYRDHKRNFWTPLNPRGLLFLNVQLTVTALKKQKKQPATHQHIHNMHTSCRSLQQGPFNMGMIGCPCQLCFVFNRGCYFVHRYVHTAARLIHRLLCNELPDLHFRTTVVLVITFYVLLYVLDKMSPSSNSAVVSVLTDCLQLTTCLLQFA